MQICGINVGLHPCGEVQLTLHLSTRRQTGTQLAAVAADSGVNSNLAARRGPDSLIHQEEGGRRAGRGSRQSGNECRQTGEVRVVGFFSFGGWGEWGVASLIPDHRLPSSQTSSPYHLRTPASHLSASGKGLFALVQLLLLPPHNNRNLQK